MLLATDNDGRTVFHDATICYKVETSQEILKSAKENLTREEVNKLLLATGNKGWTVLHVAAWCSIVEMFQEILKWAK